MEPAGDNDAMALGRNGVDHGGLALPLCRSLFEPGCAVEALAAAALSE